MEEIIIGPTKKEVQTKLNETLSNLLFNDSFKLKKSSGVICRRTQGKVESIYFRIINYWPLCQEIGCVMFDVRFDKVEDIVNPFLAKYNFFNIEGTKTTSTIGNLIDYNTRIDKIEDVDKFIYLHIKDIKEKILDYFFKYNKISAANQLYKSQILTDNSGLYYVERPVMQSLTLMRLCNDSDFEELSQKYKEIYTSWGGYKERGLNAINDLIGYLLKL
jgi:hypothetical protein